MTINLRIGIRNKIQSRILIVKSIFNDVNERILLKKNFGFSIDIQDYELLKEQFGEHNKNIILYFERYGKGLTEPNMKVILLNDFFFYTNDINKKAVFLHEIGHIINKLPIKIEGNLLIEQVYNEYLADKFLFEVDVEIFKHGKIDFDLNEIKANVDNNDKIKGIFITLGRLYYYYSFCKYEPVNKKIIPLTEKINQYTINGVYILESLNKVCINFDIYQPIKIKELLKSLYLEIGNLKVIQSDKS